MTAIKPATHDAYRLFHEGSLAFADMEANGIRVDQAYLTRAIGKMDKKLEGLISELKGDETYRLWRRRYQGKTKLGGREQLAHVLFEDLGHTPQVFGDSACPTCKGKGGSCSFCHGDGRRPSADESAFEALSSPFVKKYLEWAKFSKVRGTYLENFRIEMTPEGFIHPIFNLHTVTTYRSSCDHPNFQNMPIRDPDQGEIIRRCFIPRDGCRIVELDYERIEVHAGTWYHHDPNMMTYLHDPTTDMHRDMAYQLYMVKEGYLDKTSMKQARYAAKNMFVFPEFYGAWYLECAKHLWEWIEKMNLRMEDGRPLKEHLKGRGIHSRGACKPKERPKPGTFEAHIQKVEQHFWDVRFVGYRDWKIQWHKDYLKRGGANTLSGFRLQGVFGRNDILNYPIQGLAFHCLLWAIIRINKELRRRKMKALLIGQIHDSLVADVPDNEVPEYLAIAKSIMVDELTKAWSFICTPLAIEAEACPVGGSWFDKEPVRIAA